MHSYQSEQRQSDNFGIKGLGVYELDYNRNGMDMTLHASQCHTIKQCTKDQKRKWKAFKLESIMEKNVHYINFVMSQSATDLD